MFFVGATGQFLTLALTVVLPFVFLFSGTRNLETAAHSLRITSHAVHSEIVLTDVECSCSDQGTMSEVERVPDVPRDCRTLNLFSIGFPGKWKTIYSKSCGNKAPPVISGFIC